MDSIDDLLAQLKAEYEQQNKTQPPTVSKQLPPPTSKQATVIDDLLSQVKADYEEKDQIDAQLKEEQQKAEWLKQQQLKKQKLEALTPRAKEWLEKLEPLSSEGIWFEKFSQGYPSKIAAAIDYLQEHSA